MKLSIITINKNNAVGLEKTIQSVICQTYTDFEYIIIDGNSGDESVETIKKYTDRIGYWISEPDNGTYNAMNKGIRKAKGEYCLFLNSGDWLISADTMDKVFKEVGENTADIYYSNRIRPDNSIARFPKNLNNYLLRGKINHQNSLIKRSLFFEHGFYNEKLRICSDWEFFLNELYIHKSCFYHIETNISIYDIHGISSKKPELHEAENLIVYKNVFNELGKTIMEYSNFRNSIYYDFFANYSDSKILIFFLRVYRKIFKKSKIKDDTL
ncbi:MAG: glycosyltransferase [Treponema sp.]|nr:glycosyltransferase [Treponema sp.]